MSDSPSPSDSPSAGDSTPPAGGSPPLGTTFSLEGRPAPGLYLAGWLLSGLGLALLLVGAQTRQPLVGLLVTAGLLSLLGGLSAAAGYQVLSRRRLAARYQGPSPLLGLAIWLVLVQLIGLGLLMLDLADAERPASFLAITALQLILYLTVVWLYVVRANALTWRDIGLDVRGRAGAALRDAAVGAAVMLPTAAAALLLAVAVATLLRTIAPQVIPPPRTGADVLLVALGAVALAPIGEEVFFRGFAWSAWLRDLGARAALVRTTIFFAAVHIANVRSETFEAGVRQAILLLAVSVPVGAVLGWLRLRRGLAASIGGHVSYNGVLIVLLVLAQLLPPPSS